MGRAETCMNPSENHKTENSVSYAIHEYLIHSHTARNHQGLDNQLIVREGAGGLLSYYHREAA